MSRNQYSTSDYVATASERVTKNADEATTLLELGRALVEAVLVLAGAVADVADVTRSRE